jgi:ABC-2 type transport system permease protein
MSYSINFPLVKLLVLKDWYLQRQTILIALASGAAALAVCAVHGKLGPYIGMTLLVTVIIFVGVQLAVSTVINERKEQTLAFVMSLPISPIDYTAAKMLANLTFFFVPWLLIVAGALTLILVGPQASHGFVPFISVMGVELLLSTIVVFATALISESQGWTISVMIAGNLAFNIIGYWVAHIRSIEATMYTPRIVWTPAAITLLASELTAVVVVLGLTFFIQSRKTDFL